MALQRRILLVAFSAHITFIRFFYLSAAFVPQQLPRLAEGLLARGALEQTFHAVYLLVVEEVRGLEEAFVTQVAFEGPVCGVFVSAAVTHQRVLLLEAHLALFALEWALL